ncbi:MAG: hypothetical protein ABDH37_07935 [Candidatus Hydrothermales bacterium]
MRQIKKLRIMGIKIILTKENIIFPCGTNLKDELGWWENDTIYIYNNQLNGWEKLGILLHEFVEMVLVEKLHFSKKQAHFIANIFEFIFTLGKCTDQVW